MSGPFPELDELLRQMKDRLDASQPGEHERLQGMPVEERVYAPTDLGNAELFADLHRDRLRHLRERKRWLVWRDGRWREDASGEADRASKAIARELLLRAVKVDDAALQGRAVKWALASQSESRVRAMRELAATEPELVLTADRLDADPYVLACANGTLDLRTGELRAHNPTDLISLGTDIAYDPKATAPRWARFLDEVFAGDRELIGFVQRAVGYSLTGDTCEEVLFVCHGSGWNGKTKLIETVKRLLGDLAVTASFDSFVRARGDRGVRNDLARLHRARLVAASESGEGRRLDEAVVKQLTGGDTIVARFLYAEHIEFRPEFKLWLVSNHRPRVDGDDDAIWRRLRLIPFEVSFQGRADLDLENTLRSELPGILAWAVEGCLEWQRDRLGVPPAVEKATAEYREDEDVLGAFLAERCLLERSIAAGDFREAYEAYCRDLGEKPLASNTLGKRLGRRGIRAGRSGKRFYEGLSLKEPSAL